MLIHSASQLITLKGGPQRGRDLGSLGIIPNGAVLVRNGVIEETGSTLDLLNKYPDEERLDAAGKAVMPGFVDAHTHLVWAGDRAAEFELRVQGMTYPQIMAAGGGISATVSATREMNVHDLLGVTRLRAAEMFQHGTTTTEAKTGYGLELSSELNQLEALIQLDHEGPLEIAPTFLAAHAVPPEYAARGDDYVRHICETMLPALIDWWPRKAAGRPLPFVDVFCEQGAFSLEQTHAILVAARALGFPLKVHVDEFATLGGATLACELGAVSIDHAVTTPLEEIQKISKSNSAVVSLPCTPFGLAETNYTPALEFLSAGAILALGSDLNPGTAWCGNMQFVMALTCRMMKLTPAQALAASTINAAYAVGRHQVIGSIEPGKQADLLMLKVEDYRHLAYRFGVNLVETVIKKGVPYSAT